MAELVAACWSYSMTGLRCALPAGHDGIHEHVLYTNWSDEEAWTPDKGPLVAPRPAQGLLEALTPELGVPYEGPGVEVSDGRCFNCEHAGHDGACEAKVGQERIECGCVFAG